MLAKPYELFEHWFEKAKQIKDIKYPNAMNVATCDKDGQPTNRNVLLKEWDQDGFVFYTNLTSTKGSALTDNPKISACFYWDHFDVQIRIEGIVEQVADDQADAYFDSRDIKSRVGAWASKQSQPLSSHAHLLKRVAAKSLKMPIEKMQRPEFWSGYRIKPHRIEVMQMKDYRLHERRSFTMQNGEWVEGLLYP